MSNSARSYLAVLFLIIATPILSLVFLLVILVLAFVVIWLGFNVYAFLIINPFYADRAFGDASAYGGSNIFQAMANVIRR